MFHSFLFSILLVAGLAASQSIPLTCAVFDSAPDCLDQCGCTYCNKSYHSHHCVPYDYLSDAQFARYNCSTYSNSTMCLERAHAAWHSLSIFLIIVGSVIGLCLLSLCICYGMMRASQICCFFSCCPHRNTSAYVPIPEKL